MAVSADANVSGAAWWADRQFRFTLIVLAAYALMFLAVESGLLGGDRLGAEAVGFYAMVMAFYGVIANLFYELLAKTEALVKPRNLTTYRRRLFALALVVGIAVPWLWALVP